MGLHPDHLDRVFWENGIFADQYCLFDIRLGN